jgi:hypothetical protein
MQFALGVLVLQLNADGEAGSTPAWVTGSMLRK